MEKVVIDHAAGEPFYCPFCGAKTIPHIDDEPREFQECEHLLYIGTTETGFQFLAQEIEDKIDDETDEEEIADLNMGNAVHFSLCAPPPSGFGAYVGYKK